MGAPNRATLWGRTIVEELAASGVDAACIAPGSRSTPLTVAFDAHPDVETFSILDERSAGFFALGRSRRVDRPTALVCTSGTAAANFHPAVIEAHQSRVPLVVLTADRPAELQESGANQTIDQTDLYGDAVRFSRTLPEPAPEDRRLRSLRVAADRAVAQATGADPGPVHLNVPVGKPLEPTDVPDDVPDSLAADAPLGAAGRDGPFVRTTHGASAVDDETLADLSASLDSADRPLVVAGPLNPGRVEVSAVTSLLDATGAPLLADPLSGLRYGPHVAEHLVCGGYDAYVGSEAWPEPDVVVRVGASPTSKPLRKYLADAAVRQAVIDPAGDWPEAEFTATDYVQADPSAVLSGVAEQVDERASDSWRQRYRSAERAHWDLLTTAREEQFFEGGVLAAAIGQAPDPATMFVSNSMPIRDCDRFGQPRQADLTVLGNRGASGIDGILSSGLGAGSATADPLVIVTGDLAYYHDMNGLLSVTRCGVDATIVLVNNDGGGIFHGLPIENFDPPFTDQFKTPHGLDFEPTGDLYDLEYIGVSERAAFEDAYENSLESDGTQVVEVTLGSAESHEFRDDLERRLEDRL